MSENRERMRQRRDEMRARRREFRATLTPEQKRARRRAGFATAKQALSDVARGIVRKPRSVSRAGITTDADERRAQLSKMGLGVWLRVQLAQLRSRRASEERRKQIWDNVAVRSASDAVEILGGMKGVMMKFAQMASYNPGIPEGAQQQLAKLQAAAPTMTPELAAECIEKELGAPPGKVFKKWDREPIAAASIGQVHRAVTRDGREVAVKVQYPGVDDAIRADLANAGMLGNLVKAMGDGDIDVDALLAEVAARIIEELDYTLEASNQQWFADRYRGHPFVTVPDVVFELTTPRVLVSDFVHGQRFADFVTGPQSDKDRAGEIVHRFAFGSIFTHGLFTSDPHPGNYLFLPDGRVCFLDFGLVKKLETEGDRLAVRGPVEAILRADKPGLVRALRLAGALADGAQPDPEVVWTLMCGQFGPLYLDERLPYLMRREGKDSDETEEMRAAGRALEGSLRLPATHAFFLRYIAGIRFLIRTMGAEANWHRIAREVLFGDEPSTQIGRQWTADPVPA
jgi:hypothetical protein